MLGSGPRKLLPVLVGVFCCAALMPAAAGAAGTGEIAGTVTEAGTMPVAPIDGAHVCAQERDGGEGGGCVDADPDGSYVIEGLPEGEYEVLFDGEACVAGTCVREWAEQLFNGRHAYEEPDWVRVEEGQRESGIDAALEAFGSITGTITKEGGAPIANAVLCVDGTNGLYFNGCVLADGNGEYTYPDLPPGEYDIEFTGWVCGDLGSGCSKEECELTAGLCTHPYVTQYSFEKPILDPEELDAVTVEPRQAASGVDATLLPGGTIEGTVTLAGLGHQPLAGIEACTGNEVDHVESRCARTNANGEYTIEGLAPSADWLVRFAETCPEETCAGTYVPQFYAGKPDESEAGDPVAVAASAAVPGIDASMVEAAPQVPTFASDPAVTGTPAVGATLACSPGTWSHSVASVAYSWQRNGAVIAGQTGDSYAVTGADEGTMLTCAVRIANAAGGTTAITSGLAVPVRQEEAKTNPSSNPGSPSPTPSATASPASPPAPTPGTASASSKASAGRTVSITLSCHGQYACQGSLKLIYKQKGKQQIVIGTATFNIAVGKRRAVAVKLNAKGEKLIKKAGKAGLKVKLTGTGVKPRTLTVH